MIQIFSILVSSFLLLLVLYLIYKQKLKEQYAFLWITLAGAVLVSAIFSNFLDQFAVFFGVYYAPSLLFVFAFLIVLLMLIQMSVVISTLKDNIKTLTQEVSLLKQKQENNE